MNVPEIPLRRGGADAVRHGHPWVWRSALAAQPSGHGKGDRTSIDEGTEVQLVDENRAALGRALYDPESPIAARVWTVGRAPIDDALVSERIARALELRRWAVDSETNAYRLVHGEGDRLPGFVIDRYAHVAVLRVDGGAAKAQADRVVRLLRAPLEAAGVSTLVERSSDKGRGRVSTIRFGATPPSTIDVREHGVPFVVDLAHGQKTGAFLDQRESRRKIGEIVRRTSAARVLNLFSYAGGFSLHAALAGATTTSVDIAAQAHSTAQASFRAAGLEPRAHEFVAADAFAFLAESKRRGRVWDAIVSDPPSFAPNEKSVARALAAYRQLHRACVEVLTPGGVFCASSCSSHVDAATFATTLDDASLGRSDLRLIELLGPPADHPTLPAFPEGRYLKFAVLA
jgi:23S rRNA (cytosine1962-C5)-methyltransferase